MDKLEEQFRDKITDPLTLHSVTTVNHKPDIFCVGPKHVGYAADRGGMLGKEAMRAHPCAHCKRPYDEHTYDTVMFLQLTRNATQNEVQAVLKPICDEVEAAGIDGFGFVETTKGYRIS